LRGNDSQLIGKRMSGSVWLEYAGQYWNDDPLDDDRTVELDQRHDELDAAWNKSGKKETELRCSDKESGGRERCAYGRSPYAPMPLELAGGMLRIKAIHHDRHPGG
jgi:hypothetical protein